MFLAIYKRSGNAFPVDDLLRVLQLCYHKAARVKDSREIDPENNATCSRLCNLTGIPTDLRNPPFGMFKIHMQVGPK